MITNPHSFIFILCLISLEQLYIYEYVSKNSGYYPKMDGLDFYNILFSLDDLRGTPPLIFPLFLETPISISYSKWSFGKNLKLF